MQVFILRSGLRFVHFNNSENNCNTSHLEHYLQDFVIISDGQKKENPSNFLLESNSRQ